MQIWETNTIDAILPEEFYNLIDRNRKHISKTFPVTLVGCYNLEATKTFIQHAQTLFKNGKGYYFYVRDTSVNKLIGYIVVKNIDRKINKCELGYFVDEAYQGKGITSKMVADTVAFCFDTLHMNKIYICTSPVNNASQKIALKNGFVQEGTLRQEFKNGAGELEDIFYYGLLRTDYNNER